MKINSKVTSIIGLILISFNLMSQKILVAKSSAISFFSKTPVRDIEAENKTSASLINLDTKDIVVKIAVKNFIFPNKLMQEHFNENYLETEKFPSSTFKGKINETIDLSKDGKYPVSATGKLNMHGVEHDITLKGTATILNKKLTIDCVFDVALVDYKIAVPKLVFEEIAEKIKVTYKFNYELK
jgi:polyisoprenoid-binding protein YceI